jgi:hypothetical protein
VFEASLGYIVRLLSPEQQNQKTKTQNQKQAWWCTFIIPATWEVEIGASWS